MTPPEEAVEAVEAVGAVARVQRIQASNGVWAIRANCPYCTRIHNHGGGPTDQPPMLGERVSHCHRGSYLLAWPAVDVLRARKEHAS